MPIPYPTTACMCLRSLHLTAVPWHWLAAAMESDVHHALPPGAATCAAAPPALLSHARRDHVAAAHVPGIPSSRRWPFARRAGGRERTYKNVASIPVSGTPARRTPHAFMRFKSLSTAYTCSRLHSLSPSLGQLYKLKLFAELIWKQAHAMHAFAIHIYYGLMYARPNIS